jgi:hypothetical protein
LSLAELPAVRAEDGLIVDSIGATDELANRCSARKTG